MAVKITPAFNKAGGLEDNDWVGSTLSDAADLAEFIFENENQSTLAVRESNFPEALLQHHAKRAVQIVSLSMDFWRETQVRI